MPARIDHNAPLKQIQRNLGLHQAEAARAIEHLSSGQRVERSSDDPASLFLADSFTAEIRAFAEGNRNAQQGIGMLQVVDSSLGQMSEVIQRLQTLAVQAATGLFKEEERGSIDREVQLLKDELDRIAGSTLYNGAPLLQADRRVAVQTGPSAASSRDFIELEFRDMRARGPFLNIGALTVGTIQDAGEAISQLRLVEEKVSGERNRIAAFQNRLELSSSTSTLAIQRLRETESAVRDIDMARAVTDMTRAQILSQAAASFAVEADADIDRVLSLLQ